MTLEKELARLYDGHAQAVYAFLLQLTRNDADAGDLLQELFIKLAKNPLSPAGVRHERAFLLRVAHNLVIDLARRRAAREQRHERWVEQSPLVFAPAAREDEQEFRRALSDALATLPADQRAVVHLKLWEQLTFEEIASALEISPNTAASRYRYGIDKLRERLRPLYDEIK